MKKETSDTLDFRWLFGDLLFFPLVWLLLLISVLICFGILLPLSFICLKGCEHI